MLLAYPWTPLPSTWRSRAFTEPGTILLESSSPSETEHHSYLFTNPTQILTANHASELPNLFEQIEAARAAGHHVAGWFAYEAGAHFLNIQGHHTQPLAVLGVFHEPQIFNHHQPQTTTPEEPKPLQIAAMPTLPRAAYDAAIRQIQTKITAGETYQLNFTMQLQSPCNEAPATVYNALQHQQPCSYAAVIRLQPEVTILALSPELFFRTTPDGAITTRPMKGTAPRGATPEQDEAFAQALRQDEKNRAEHVMIVDLLRNDLGRICEHGTVTTPDLFKVERYETLHQMTSTIQGQLRPDTPWYEVFRALFPCGSITGAPKHHTARLISQIEQEPRGPYTGAIGYFAPDRSACFNVAIRTAVLSDNKLTLGVGGGIVADSTAEAEYNEALLKAAFLQRASEPVKLLETMRWQGSFPFLEQHLTRLQASCQSLGFHYDEQQLRSTLQALTRTWDATPRRVRLQHTIDGLSLLTSDEVTTWPSQLRIVLAPQQTQANAPHLQHKTTFRPEYAPAFLQAQATGHHEAIFRNERGELTEGCISNLILKINNQWLAPRRTSGVLPGIYRASLLQRGLIHEQTLTLHDLSNATYVCLCNAVRGVGNVTSLTLPNGETLHWQPAIDTPW